MECNAYNPIVRICQSVRNRGVRIFSLRLLICAVTLLALPVLSVNLPALVVNLPAHAAYFAPLVWNPSVRTNVAGYKIYYGVESQTYTNSVDVGNVTNAIITGLSGNTTYYFAATSYDAFGDESGFSNEAAFAPIAFALTSTSYVNGQFAVNVSGVTNQCVVQASTNFVNWVSLQTNAAPFAFVDPNAGQFGQRFYRAYYLP
jgi:hypothetical protein